MLLLGTTESPYDGDPADVEPEPVDAEQILREAAHALSPQLVERSRVRAAYAGLRVLPAGEGEVVSARRETVFSRGPGGMLSVVLRGGEPAARRFLGALKWFALAESLGGVESLAEHPALMTHASIPRPVRESIGIGDGLVRLSVGLEHVEDLWSDLLAALAAAEKGAV